MASFLLQEDGDLILLEDASGALLLELSTSFGDIEGTVEVAQVVSGNAEIAMEVSGQVSV